MKRVIALSKVERTPYMGRPNVLSFKSLPVYGPENKPKTKAKGGLQMEVGGILHGVVTPGTNDSDLSAILAIKDKLQRNKDLQRKATVQRSLFNNIEVSARERKYLEEVNREQSSERRSALRTKFINERRVRTTMRQAFIRETKAAVEAAERKKVKEQIKRYREFVGATYKRRNRGRTREQINRDVNNGIFNPDDFL